MSNSFFVPPEWAPHKAIWTAWPTTEDLWLDELEAVRVEVGAMVKALAEGDTVKVLACGDEVVHSARSALGLVAEVIPMDYGDIWLRDTGPVFSKNSDDQSLRAEVFQFNGWGEKYIMPFDHRVAECVASLSKTPVRRHDFILEGGAVDTDGNGTVLTTRQCLLNPNRNKGWTEAQAEAALMEAYGARKVVWLGDGLLNDHTDGHVDNIARFVAPGRVVCQSPNGADDPNADTLRNIEAALRDAVDADGGKLDVITIPSPGLLTTPSGDPIPASHMNFIIGNRTVVVPTYNDQGVVAVAALAKIFPSHKVIGLSAHAILTAGGDDPGGGAFHCMTQQEPA
jgi:agmatine deiminase